MGNKECVLILNHAWQRVLALTSAMPLLDIVPLYAFLKCVFKMYPFGDESLLYMAGEWRIAGRIRGKGFEGLPFPSLFKPSRLILKREMITVKNKLQSMISKVVASDPTRPLKTLKATSMIGTPTI